MSKPPKQIEYDAADAATSALRSALTTEAPFAAVAKAFCDLCRAKVGTLSIAVLDEHRRLGERVGADIALGDMTGNELAALCDHEIAARYVVEAA